MDNDNLRPKSRLDDALRDPSIHIDELLDGEGHSISNEVKFLHKGEENTNRDLELPLLQPSVSDPDRRICKPDGMLVGPDHPFFNEEIRSHRSRNPRNVRYDVIGPFGNEPDPDLDFYPLLRKSGTTQNPPNPFDAPGFNFMDRNPFSKF